MPSFDPSQKRDTTDNSWEDACSFIPMYGERVLSIEAYNTLFDLFYKNFDLEEGFESVTNEKDEMIDLGISVKALEEECLAVASNIRFKRSKDIGITQKRLFFDKLNEIADMITGFVENTLEEVQSTFSIESSEELKKDVSSAILRKYLYKLDYVIPRENIVTDIGGVVSSLIPTPEKVKQAFKRIRSLKDKSSDIDDSKKDELLSAIVPVEIYGKFLTSLPPSFWKYFLIELDNQRVLFFDKIKACITFSKDVLTSALTNYEESGLSSEAILDEMNITQDGYNIVVVWDNPALITKEILNYQEELKEMVHPLKNLLKELGGDLNISLDKFEIRAVITCPKQTEPEFSLIDLNPDSVVLGFTQGEEVIDPDTTLVRVLIPNEDDTIEITMCKIFLSEDENRNKLLNLLSYLDELNKNRRLAKMSVYSKIDGEINITLEYKTGQTSDVENTIIRLSLAGNIDEKTAAAISSIAELSHHAHIRIKNIDLSTLNILLESLPDIVKKVEEIEPDEKFYLLEKTEDGSLSLEVDDSDNYIIAKAVFINGSFCGRCHEPDLTERVLDAYDDIFNYVQYGNYYLGEPIHPSIIIEELEKRGIFVTDNVVNLLYDIYQGETEQSFYDIVDDGMAVIEEKQYGISIDIPANDKEEYDFLLKHRL